MEKKRSVGIAIIGILELIISFLGCYILYFGLRYVLGFYNIPQSVTDIHEFKDRQLFQGEIDIIWSLPYLAMLPVGIGMLMKKEWARKISMHLIPLAILCFFPLYIYLCLIIAIIEERFGLSYEKHSVLVGLMPVFIFLLIVFLTSYFIRKYLGNPKVKEQFK